MGWFTRNVTINFIDDATGAVFATTKMPPTDLPETFEIATTMHIGDVDWSVVQAEPATRKQFSATGALTLRLRKVEKIPLDDIRYSQTDITERFDDHLQLGNDDWIATIPLNTLMKHQASSGLPPPDADADEVYRVASQMSEVREMINVPNDGVYCPICHIANIDPSKLRSPCPQCGRGLLKFGWT